MEGGPYSVAKYRVVYSDDELKWLHRAYKQEGYSYLKWKEFLELSFSLDAMKFIIQIIFDNNNDIICFDVMIVGIKARLLKTWGGDTLHSSKILTK